MKDITLTEPIVINKKITLKGADKTISISFNNLSIVERPNTVLIISAATEVEVSNLTILVTDYLNAKLEKEWNGIYGIQVSDGASNAKLNNITVTGCDRGILVNGSTATLSGRITVTGNKKGGIEVSASEAKPEAEAKLIIATEDITNGSESKGNPTLYQGTGENVKLDGGKLSQGANDTEKKEIHFYIRAENALHELITAAIETLAENGESSYSVDADANVINATFTNGTKKISDLMGSGLFNTAIPSLIEAGVTEIKIGNDVLINQTTTANVQVLLDALAKIIADNETTTPDSSVAVNETVDILQQPLSSLNGKALSITFTYATKMNIVGFINDTYTLVFSVTTTTNPDVGGITASVESWETETIVELKN